MTTTEELYDDEGNLITDNDTVDYKELFEKQKAESEKRENRFKGTAKELNEYKQTQRPQSSDDEDGVSGANEYLKTHGINLLREQGMISRDDLASELQKQLQAQREIEKLDKFPDLTSEKKDAILQLSKVDGLSIEETIKKYKFIDDDSMENFHKPTIGSKKKTPGTINWANPTAEDIEYISKMSPEEFDKAVS